MRILVLSFYYPPDLSAGSFRTGALVEALTRARVNHDDVMVDVVTTMPNRYSEFQTTAPENERCHWLNILRIRLPDHKSGLLDQSRAFGRFAHEATRYVRNRKYDAVYATSSRLMTAALGAWIARRQQARLYLDIRDLFAITIRDVLPYRLGSILRPLLMWVERLTISQADRVNLVSGGFKPYFAARYPSLECSFVTNGVDDEFANAADHVKTRGRRSPFTVLYAGNIGDGQGLDTIVPELAKRMSGRIRFRLIGSGGRIRVLREALGRIGADNVEILPPVNRNELIQEYRDADVLFLHLNDYEVFRSVLPSKVFEYAAMGKPIWAGVSGFAADFVKSEIRNSVVFHPGDANEAEEMFAKLCLVDTPRKEFVERFARQKLMKAMADDLLALARD